MKKLYGDEAKTDGLINLAMVITIVISGMGLFGLAGLLAVGVAVLTVGFHAMRAGLVSPVKSLRSE